MEEEPETVLFCAWCDQPIDPYDKIYFSSAGACCSQDCKEEIDYTFDDEEEEDY